MKKLRYLTEGARFTGVLYGDAAFGDANLCELVWQGDFANGQPTGSGTFGSLGCNPCLLYLASSLDTPQPQFKLGQVVKGDYGTEWLYCRLVLASTTDLIPGDVYQIDENFLAAKLVTSGVILNAPVGVAQVFVPGSVAGTYYLWLAIRGRLAVHAAASSIATGMAESTATAGTVKFLNSHTSGAMTVGQMQAFQASSNITFKGDTVSGSPTIVNVASQISLNGAVGGITDLVPGMTITGTNLPSNACIAAIRRTGTTWAIDIGTSTTGAQKTLQNATGTAAATTFTVTTHVQADLNLPTETVQN